MRCWHIDPGYLDPQRLVAQHREIHMCLTCVSKGREWGNTTRDLKHSLQYAEAVHNAVIQEIEKRGGKRHPQDFQYKTLPEMHWSKTFEPTYEIKVKDVKELRAKWEREEYYFGVGRLDLGDLEEELGLVRGKTKEQAAEIRDKTRQLVKENKIWFISYVQKNPRSRMQDRIAAFREAVR